MTSSSASISPGPSSEREMRAATVPSSMPIPTSRVRFPSASLATFDRNKNRVGRVNARGLSFRPGWVKRKRSPPKSCRSILPLTSEPFTLFFFGPYYCIPKSCSSSLLPWGYCRGNEVPLRFAILRGCSHTAVSFSNSQTQKKHADGSHRVAPSESSITTKYAPTTRFLSEPSIYVRHLLLHFTPSLAQVRQKLRDLPPLLKPLACHYRGPRHEEQRTNGVRDHLGSLVGPPIQPPRQHQCQLRTAGIWRLLLKRQDNQL